MRHHLLVAAACLCLFEGVFAQLSNMSKRTVLNENYKGLVESLSIPAELHERDGKMYASTGSVVPIHCCSEEEVSARAQSTHHYCDIFSEQLLAPIGELAYVRLDENTAEKVFINRTKRILLVSSDGRLAQWRCAPTFESANSYVAGAPVVNAHGDLVSVVTAKRGNHYAVSNVEGEGGYFDTPLPWSVVAVPAGHAASPMTSTTCRPLVPVTPPSCPPPPAPVLLLAAPPRVALTAPGGRQLAHTYLPAALASDVHYL